MHSDSELIGFSPRIDWDFPTASLKLYFEGSGLGFKAEILVFVPQLWSKV